jgi:hypothetical protein
MEIKVDDLRILNHKVVKTITFDTPIKDELTCFEVTYYNEGTKKFRTEKIHRKPTYYGNRNNKIEFFVRYLKKKIFFVVEKRHVMDF